MVKVITYGSYDLLHYGHIRLLERAKALGDYLIVGVTSDDYDKTRGKINLTQSLIERIEAVKATGIADEIIVEEYEGQKIDDIKRLGVDIFTVGSDWEGYFDYLSEYCQVKYLPRTEGISSSEIRSKERRLKLGLVGGTVILQKYYNECKFVNGIELVGVMTDEAVPFEDDQVTVYKDYDSLLEVVDAVYIVENPRAGHDYVRRALEKCIHVLCEAPISLTSKEYSELLDIANSKQLILMDAIKTAYSTAYNRLLVIAKSGKIGQIVSVEATCTSLRDVEVQPKEAFINGWSSMHAWGPTALLPVFQLLGTNYANYHIISKLAVENVKFDLFTKINFVYNNSVASIKVGKGAKSEGELIISGTKGYIYVPAPWWKTDYFEIRYENGENNKRYFYQLDGEGIRYELVAFARSVSSKEPSRYVDVKVTKAIIDIIDNFEQGNLINI